YCVPQENVSSLAFFAGIYEVQECAFAKWVLRPGMCFVDVGANWGFFSLVAAHVVGTRGRVISLEPDPRMFARLQSNITRNHLNQVQIFELAAADCDNAWTLSLQDESVLHLGTSRFIQVPADAGSTCTVHSRPLDPLLNEAKIETVDLVKIDVE